MYRFLLILLIICVSVPARATEEASPDSLPKVEPKPSQTLFLIPCGEAIGTFSEHARVSVDDTVGGWAKVYVEGWIPVSGAIPLLEAKRASFPALVAESEKEIKKPEPPKIKCIGLTSKGNPCTRFAQKGSKYCWQHQPR